MHPPNPEIVTETALRHWEAEARRYREVHDRSPDGMMIFRALRGADGKIVDFEWLYSNASASRIVGRRSEDLLGKRLLIEMPGNKQAGLFEIYCRVVELGEPHSHEFAYQYEGLDSWFRSTSIKLGDGFYVAFSDLTARKHAEEQEARLAAIVRSSEHAIYSTNNESILETWNQGAEKLYGYTSKEIIGQPVWLIVPEQCRAEREAARQRVVERGGVESHQTLCLTKSGLTVHGSVTLSAISDVAGRIVGLAVIARDISQEITLQERLVVADRMVSVGTLAAGMAHEINNPLACVSGNLDMAIEELRALGAGSSTGRLKEMEGMMLEARAGAERIKRIVRGLMTFSRADEERRTVVDIEPVLDLSIGIAFNEIERCARLTKEYGPIPSVLVDEARLGQVFISLLINAAQAIGEGDPGANEIRVATSTDDAGRAVLEVHDTGPGIAPSVIGRIFDPFFTTKPVGQGIGLGLSVCRNIVSDMGGEISALNRPSGGATFRVLLPPSPQQAGRTTSPTVPTSAKRTWHSPTRD